MNAGDDDVLPLAADALRKTPSLALCQGGLVVLVLLVFGRLVLADFTWWDDVHTVHHNATMNPDVTWAGLVQNWTSPTASIYIPVTYTAWMLIALVARVPADDAGITLNPMLYHGFNVIVHAFSAVLAFRLLDHLLRHRLAAVVGAAVFAVHPVQVESVAWISGLKDTLSGCLVLASLCLYCNDGKDRRSLRYGLSLAVYVLAMLAKPSAMVTPLLLLAIDRLLLQRPWRESLVRLWPFVVLAIPIAIIARLVQIAPAPPAPLWSRPLIVTDSLAFYLGKVIAPITLTIDYGRRPQAVIESGAIWYTWLIPLLALGVIAWIARRTRSHAPSCAAALFVLAPLPVLGLARFEFQEISTVADHYLYVAMLGPALLAAWAVTHWRWAGPAVAVIVLALGVRSFAHTPVWQNEMSLMTHALAANPRSLVAHNNLANQAGTRGDAAAERAYLLAGLAIDPANPIGLGALGRMSLREGDLPAALQYFDRVIASFENVYPVGHPKTALPRWQAADALLNAGHPDAAERYANDAKRIAPTDPNTARIADRIARARQPR